MDGSIIFYIYDKCIELNGKQFSAGELTADFLNISSDEYYQMHRCMTSITELTDTYDKSKGKDTLWEINNSMEQLCNLLRRYTVFNVLLGEDEELFFSVFRRLTEQYDFFSAAERTVSKSERLRQIKSIADKFLCCEDDSSERVDLLALHTTDDENKAAFFNELYRMLGVTGEAWSQYKEHIERYKSYLHDIRAFNGTICNFINFRLSKLEHNSPEDYAAALYVFYNDERTAEKLIVNPIRNNGYCFRLYDDYNLSYVPRELPNGKVVISQKHMTDSVQALLKADYILALNSGYNIRRCVVCNRYFLLKSGAHALYCDGASPYDPRYSCRQFGTFEIQKELARDNPKIAAKNRAFARIDQDRKRGNISRDDCRKAKDHVRDIECVRSGNYNNEKGLLTTFVTPFIDGAMRRHMETSLGTLSLDRDDMVMARNAQRLYNSEYMDVSEIAAELNISDKDAARYISYATHFLGFEDLSDDDSDVFEYLLEDKSAEDPALIIYRRERMKLFKELFDALPKKDRDILGKCYGVFGYQKEPLKSIAMYHLMKVDAVEKSKNTAIKKVRKLYVGSMMQLWDDVHRLMRRPIFPP